MDWHKANDIKSRIEQISITLELDYLNTDRIFCYRSEGSTSRAYARTWSFPKIFQDALSVEPAYVIEVLNKYFDKLNYDQQTQVLIHEILHIPKNFSGALLPHRTRHSHLETNAKKLFKEYKNRIK